MTGYHSYKLINIGIASVWLINGLICKVMNIIPRHEQIVASILSDEYSRALTIIIGISEIIMAVWVLSKFKSKINAVVQILIVGLMNVIEFTFVPQLLFWGKLNAFFAVLFILVVYYNEFILNSKTQ